MKIYLPKVGESVPDSIDVWTDSATWEVLSCRLTNDLIAEISHSHEPDNRSIQIRDWDHYLPIQKRPKTKSKISSV
jgi:hypothetical protein